jgi:malate/lactate dehydrogenase
MEESMKITIIGMGNVGSLTAFSCLMQHDMIIDLDLIDINQVKAKSEAADLLQAAEVQGIKRDIHIVDSPKESDIYIIALGSPLRDGSTDRISKYDSYKGIITDYAEMISRVRKEHSTLLIVTNPSTMLATDAMRHLPFVIPVGNLLDNARYRLCCVSGSHEKPDILKKYLEVKSGKDTQFGVVSEIMQYIMWHHQGFHEIRW